MSLAQVEQTKGVFRRKIASTGQDTDRWGQERPADDDLEVVFTLAWNPGYSHVELSSPRYRTTDAYRLKLTQ